jgi:hypothetical protein
MKSAIKMFILVMIAGFGMSVLSARADEDERTEHMGMMKMREQMEHGKNMEEKFLMKVMFILANAQDFGLSDEQINKINGIKFRVKKGLIASRAEIEGYEVDLMEAMEKDQMDVNAINGILDKKFDAKKKSAKDLVSACNDLRQILMPEQFKIIKSRWMSRMAYHMKKMMGDKEEGCGCGGGMMMRKKMEFQPGAETLPQPSPQPKT